MEASRAEDKELGQGNEGQWERQSDTQRGEGPCESSVLEVQLHSALSHGSNGDTSHRYAQYQCRLRVQPEYT